MRDDPDDALLLHPTEFFRGGFGSYTAKAGNGNLEVAPGTHIDLKQTNRELLAAAYDAPSGTRFSDITRNTMLLDVDRAATNLTLGASIVRTPTFERYADLIIGTGSIIQLDRKGALALTSNSRVLIDGTITAPAGSVTVQLDRSLSGDGYLADQGVWLGSRADINVAGIPLLVPTQIPGQLVGDVLDGGTVSIDAKRGFIVTHSDSVINVSGTSAAVDIVHPDGKATRENIYSSAGTISLASAEGMLLNGEFRAQGGAPNAAGGALNITVDATGREDTPQPGVLFSAFSGPRSITVTAGGGANLLGWQTNLPSQFQGKALVSADAINAGAFDKVSLTARNLEAPIGSTDPMALARSISMAA